MHADRLARPEKLWSEILSVYLQTAKLPGTMSYVGIHDYDHVYRVWENVKSLRQHLDMDNGLNFELIEFAAILHDIGYLFPPAASQSVQDHVSRSVAVCESYLRSISCVDSEIAAVKEIIREHHNDLSATMNMEKKVLIVADQLDLLGMDGTLREFIRMSSSNQNRDEMAKIIIHKSQQRYEKLVQFHICDALVTERWQQSEEYLQMIIMHGHQN
jgi:HD superfamily phosphodiesterase